jgi:hypothetical protein
MIVTAAHEAYLRRATDTVGRALDSCRAGRSRARG